MTPYCWGPPHSGSSSLWLSRASTGRGCQWRRCEEDRQPPLLSRRWVETGTCSRGNWCVCLPIITCTFYVFTNIILYLLISGLLTVQYVCTFAMDVHECTFFADAEEPDTQGYGDAGYQWASSGMLGVWGWHLGPTPPHYHLYQVPGHGWVCVHIAAELMQCPIHVHVDINAWSIYRCTCTKKYMCLAY